MCGGCFGAILFKFFKGDFAVGDGGLTGFTLLLALRRFLFGPDGARFLELVIAESAARQRSFAHGIIQPRAHPFEGGAAQFEIAVFDFRIERVPEILDQAAQQAQACCKPAKPSCAERLGEPGGQLQIFRLRGQRLAGQLDYQLVIGDFTLALPFALAARRLPGGALP